MQLSLVSFEMRNPKWLRQEIILALDLYFDSERGGISASNSKVIALSEKLNELKLDVERTDIERFRNPNGVSLKLSNFLAIDPTYIGKGMKKGSKLDKLIFEEFFSNREDLKEEAGKYYMRG